jgi:hypothetical protein
MDAAQAVKRLAHVTGSSIDRQGTAQDDSSDLRIAPGRTTQGKESDAPRGSPS